MQLPLTELGTMVSVDEADLRIKNTGIKLIGEGKGKEAAQVLRAFCQQYPEDGHARSFLGLAFAMSQNGKRGLQLCRQSAERHPFDSEVHHNLGRVYLMAGKRRMAWDTFILAARLDRDNNRIERELNTMGKRRPPVIPGLPRSHPVNILAGRLLTKAGLR